MLTVGNITLELELASSSERLHIAMRYLVTGDALVTISTSCRISPTTVGRIIK